MPATAFQAVFAGRARIFAPGQRRLKAGGSQDWLPYNRCRTAQRGSMSIQLAVILVPVVFGLMGFALDLGRPYLVRGE